MTRIEIRVLECLCRLEVCSHVKDRILVESDTFNFSAHRRAGNFRQGGGGGGGAVNHLPKKILQVAQMFTKQSKKNEGLTMQQHRPYWYMKVPSLSINYVAINKR